MVNAATIVSSAVSFVLPKAWCGVRTHVVMNSLKKMHCQVLREELCCDIVICNAFSFPSCIFLSSFAPLSEWQQQYFFFLLRESIARCYLCDWHKDFAVQRHQLCSTDPVIVEHLVYRRISAALEVIVLLACL